MRIAGRVLFTLLSPVFSLSGFAACTIPITNGYGYCRSLTINHLKVPNTDQTDFPVLASFTDASFKTVANGGHVSNATTCCASVVAAPADMIFTSDNAGSTLLDWDFERYIPTTGEIVAWVRIPTVSHTVDTVFYMFYGKPSVVTYQAVYTSVWTTGYKYVGHLSNGTSLSGSDSTTNGNNATVTGTVTAAAGQIDGGAANSTTNSYLSAPDSPTLEITQKLTITAWVNVTGRNINGSVILWRGNSSNLAFQNYSLYIVGTGQQTLGYNNGSASLESVGTGTPVPIGSWQYIGFSLDETAGTKLTFYLNGVSDSTPVYVGNLFVSALPQLLYLTNFAGFIGAT